MRRALALIVLVPLAVGCGAKKSALDGSADAMKDAGSSRIEMRSSATDDLSYSMTGVIDYARDRGDVVIRSTWGNGNSDLPEDGMRARFIGRTSYFGLSLGGKMRWQKETDEASGEDSFLPGPGGARPDRLLELLVKSSEKVEVLGTDDIRGVAAKHYRAHLDPKKQGDEFSYYGREKLVIDAWIDEDGLARRIRVPEGGSGSTIVDLFDFGVEVDIEAPPADEILSDKEFNRLLKKECLAMRGEKPPPESQVFCAMSGVDEGSSEIGPIETVPTITEPPE